MSDLNAFRVVCNASYSTHASQATSFYISTHSLSLLTTNAFDRKQNILGVYCYTAILLMFYRLFCFVFYNHGCLSKARL